MLEAILLTLLLAQPYPDGAEDPGPVADALDHVITAWDHLTVTWARDPDWSTPYTTSWEV